MPDPQTWLSELPAKLAPQRRLMDRLLRWCQQEDAVHWLMIGCSLARGNADRLSDLDLAMGVRPGRFDETLPRIFAAVGEVGELVDCYDHDFGQPYRHRRVFALYSDRTQIDLFVAESAADSAGPTFPYGVTLYDPDSKIRYVGTEAVAPKGDELRTWEYLAWTALLDTGKYLRRSSLWEALHELEEGRRYVERLWVTLQGIPESRYPARALSDAPEADMPAGFDAAVAGRDERSLLRAARYLAELLDQLGGEVSAASGHPRPVDFARFVRSDLDALDVL